VITDQLEYMRALNNTRAARERHNYAAEALHVAEVEERLAEIKCQHEPLNSISKNEDLVDREKMYAAAFYVVFGRVPGAVGARATNSRTGGEGE
jgi:hypothetical protein